MGLRWMSHSTPSAGLESKIIWPIIAVITVSVITTWILCGTWILLTSFRIACQPCRILCMWTVSLGTLYIFSRHAVTSIIMRTPRHFVVNIHPLLVSESVFSRILWVIMKSWRPEKLEVGVCDCLDQASVTYRKRARRGTWNELRWHAEWIEIQ
jgi:hypothetical protein